MKVRKRKQWVILSMLAVLMTLAACQSKETEEKGPHPELPAPHVTQQITITPKISALFKEETVAKSRSVSSSEIYLTGTLNITTTDQSNQPVDGSPFPVTILFDESSKTATLSQTFALSPGSYKGVFNLKGSDNQQYAGESVFIVNEGGNTAVSLPIHPIIGDSSVQINSFTDLNRVRFQYPAAQLDSFTYPSIRITINDSKAVTYGIVHQDSSADKYRYINAYLDLELGNNKVELAFFDGSNQIGKSHPNQESRYIQLGEDIQMNIVPLEGRIGFDFPVSGDDAEITVQLPNAINDVSADQMTLRVSMYKGRVIKSQAENNITGSYGNYQSVLTLPELYHGDYKLLLELFENTTKSKLGECSTLVTLDVNNQVHPCDFRIYLAHIAAFGDLLGSVNVTTLSSKGIPVNGALIQLDGITKTTSGGITGDGDENGYGHFYHKPGTYTVTALLDGQQVAQQITVTPLQTKNLILKFDEKVEEL